MVTPSNTRSVTAEVAVRLKTLQLHTSTHVHDSEIHGAARRCYENSMVAFHNEVINHDGRDIAAV